MKRSASHRPNEATSNEAGFTLTEVVAALLVASMLIVGLADVTRRYALSSVRVKDAIADMRTNRLVASLMGELERADPDSLEVTPTRLFARIGSHEVRAELTTRADRQRWLEWTSPVITRSLRMPSAATFEMLPSGAVLLTAAKGEPPLAVVLPRRQTPFDCRFDTVSRDCR